MRFSMKVVRTFLVCGVLGMALPCAAQTTGVSVSYNFLRLDGENMPGGWYADVAAKVRGSVAVVGQVTGNYKTFDLEGISIDAKMHTISGGLRGSGPSTGQVVPFAQ